MTRRQLVSLADVTPAELHYIVGRTAEFAGSSPAVDRVLGGKVVGLLFQHPSTRTRTAFSSGAQRLGADVVAYGPDDLQLNTGETAEDTARVMAAMLDLLVVRSSVPTADLRVFAAGGTLSVVNAMNADEHPTQALADLGTMFAVFGGLAGLRVLYCGEGNSTVTALIHACAVSGLELHLRTPVGYGVPADLLDWAHALGAAIEQRHDMANLLAEVDVVYTTRWQTTGTVKPTPNWRAGFVPFQVNDELMDRYPSARFMHDLPAHRGEEVTASVLDGDRSIAFPQAGFKLYSAMAALEWCLLA